MIDRIRTALRRDARPLLEDLGGVLALSVLLVAILALPAGI